jgi:hypothetical protein
MFLLPLALTVGFATVVPGQATNTDTNPIVVTSDPTQVTHTMVLAAAGLTATLGFDANGGGYWNSLNLNNYFGSANGQELAGSGCGRGGQLAEFDRAHNNDYYNPTQAGSGATLCAPISMIQTTRKLCTSQFNMPLFQAQGNVFTDFRSEQDLQACYIDRSAMFGMPAMQIDFLIGYVRPPKAIHQFDYIYDGNFAVQDINGSHDGLSVDLSRQQLIWGFRLNYIIFQNLMWLSSGVWQSQALGAQFDCQTGVNNTSYVYANGQIVRQNGISTCGGIDSDFQCLTANTNAVNPSNTSVCLYWPLTGPDSTNNVYQTWVVPSSQAAGQNWHVQSRFRSDIADPPINSLADLKFVHSLAGVIPPDDWQGSSGRGFLLICDTPAHCATAIAAWRAAAHTGDEAP